MAISTILDFIETQCLGEMRKELKEKDECGFAAQVQKHEQKLVATMNDDMKKELRLFKNSILLQLEEIYNETDTKLLNIGIKIGMELQKAFDEEEW